jgi:hypothetical protein
MTTLQNQPAQQAIAPAEVDVNLSAMRLLFVSLTHLAVSATIFMIASAFMVANWLRRRQKNDSSSRHV